MSDRQHCSLPIEALAHQRSYNSASLKKSGSIKEHRRHSLFLVIRVRRESHSTSSPPGRQCHRCSNSLAPPPTMDSMSTPPTSPMSGHPHRASIASALRTPRSSSRLSLGGRRGSSRASDEDSKTAVKVGECSSVGPPNVSFGSLSYSRSSPPSSTDLRPWLRSDPPTLPHFDL